MKILIFLENQTNISGGTDLHGVLDKTHKTHAPLYKNFNPPIFQAFMNCIIACSQKTKEHLHQAKAKQSCSASILKV